MNELPPESPELSELSTKENNGVIDSRESSENLEEKTVIAEDIALLQIQLEEKILSNRIPEEEWSEVARDFIAENPKLAEYEGLILTYVKRCAGIKKDIENAWNSALVSVENEDNTMEVALTVADQIGLDLKKLPHLTSARVVKNSQAFVFYLDDISFMNFHAAQIETVEDLNHLQHMTGSNDRSTYAVPIIILKEGEDKNRTYIRYENQNLKNHSLISYVSDIDNMVYLKGKGRDFAERKINEDPIEGLLENKILSLFAVWINTSPDTSDSKERIERFADSVITEVGKNELPRYMRFAGEIQEDAQGTEAYYKEVIENGVGWMMDLIMLYGPVYGEKSVEIAINTLQQFKIAKWPLVAQIIVKNRLGPDVFFKDFATNMVGEGVTGETVTEETL